MKYFVDREADDGGCLPPVPERHEFDSYDEAIAWLRKQVSNPDENGSFVIVEGVVIVLRVWRDPGSGRWFDSGKYA